MGTTKIIHCTFQTVKLHKKSFRLNVDVRTLISFSFRPQQNYYIKSETLIRYKLSNVDFSRWSKTSNASKYSLVAVVNHYGSMNSGHYTAFCNDGKRWYYCDDQNIRPAEPTEVENNVYAYLLFYSSLPQPSIRLPVMSSN